MSDGGAHPFPLSEQEVKDLQTILKNVRESYERWKVPEDLTEKEKKKRVKQINRNRQRRADAAST